VKILEECPEVVIRGWKMGDTISPYGMNGTKLVSDIFTENKYSAFQKNNALLLATATSDTILWAVNLRASRHYAVTADDEMYLKLEYSC
jgi:tRNA(Ile)-lysidine synthase